MTERLGAADPARFPPLAPPYVRTIPAGTLLGRIYSAGGLHPTTWHSFRAYGPTANRFDHQPPPPRVHPVRRVSYAAVAVPDHNGNIYPLLKTCIAEVFRDRAAVELRRDDPYFALFRSTRALKLLDLSDSDWVTIAGGNAAITSGIRSRSRAWARAIYRHYRTAIDGVVYAPSNVPPARSTALWEQAEDAVGDRPAFNEPLRHVGLRSRVETYAADLRLPVVP